MKRILLLVTVLALALAVPAQAQDHILKLRKPAVTAAVDGQASAARVIWYVTPYTMAYSIWYAWDGGDITYAYCRGLFGSRHIWRNGRWYFHRFRCAAETYQSEWYDLTTTIINRYQYRWRVVDHYYEAGRR
jgi:hypothetical protein